LKPKLELTIIATQKAIKITKNGISLHFLLCLMIPPIWVFPSLDGYLPITAPKGPLISHTLTLSSFKRTRIYSHTARERERERERERGRERVSVKAL
jgi:hypothetical protein